MKQKIVSIIIPIYNSKDNIERCINSCINQTYRNIEIVCINDGSTDNSLEILKKYKKMDSRINIINQKNMGVSVARNNGIKSCKGDFITFLDSDDYLFDNSIYKMVEIMKKENADIIRTNYMRVFENNIKKKNNNSFIKNRRYNRKDIINDVLDNILSGKISSHLWLLCIKRELIMNNDIEFIPGIRVMQDKLFYIKLFSKANSFYQSDEITYNYFCNYNSTIMSKEKRLMRIDYIIEVSSLCESILEEEKLINFVNLKNLYTSHFIGICRELLYCKENYDIIEKLRNENNNPIFRKIIYNVEYSKIKIHHKIILFLLRHHLYKTLKLFTKLIFLFK